MPLFFSKMETRHLHNSDIKKLVRVLLNSPNSHNSRKGDDYSKSVEATIKKLPRRLRSSPLSSHRALCRIHKGLDAHLIDDIWSWIKYELEVGIGRFLYPIIMSGILSKHDELRARQLEPVVRMFNPSWTLAKSPPPGIHPIDAGEKWTFQKNGCPACMLARIGSDEGVLFALFAGMYGHHRSRSGGQKGVDKINSKRLRFVRYWMRTHTDGEQKTSDAYDLGVELKALRHEARASLQRSGQPTRYMRVGLDEVDVTARHRFDYATVAVMDISGPCIPEDRTTDTLNDLSIDPIPPFNPKIPLSVESWNNDTLPELPRTGVYVQPLTPRSTHMTEDDNLPPLSVSIRTNVKRQDSVIQSAGSQSRRPASSVYSSPSHLTLATSIASFNNPGGTSCAPRYDSLDTPEERLEKYRLLLKPTPLRWCADKLQERA